MAASTAGAYRPEFPDRDRPLYTPDEEAQRQVVARIARARKGRKTRKTKEPEGASAHSVAATITITRRRGLPMGEHPHVGRKVLGAEWGVGHTTADKLAKHPENLDPWQVRQLCALCGVTLEWLRGWEDVNAFGQYETTDTVAAMYSHLNSEDQALVCDLLTRLLGADAVCAIEGDQWRRDNREWLTRNPERAKEIVHSVQKALEPVWEPIREAMRPALEPMQAHAQTLKDRYTTDEWKLMEQTAESLKARGVDADSMTPDELLAIAHGEPVED